MFFKKKKQQQKPESTKIIMEFSCAFISKAFAGAV